MKTNIIIATSLLDKGDYTCVLCKDEIVYTSTERGVKPLLDMYDSKTDLKGFTAADKVVGKAAAFLYVLLGVEKVYAPVMSKPAMQILISFGVKIQSKLLVPEIINRQGTGRCPMEEAVDGITDAKEALAAIRSKLEKLKASHS